MNVATEAADVFVDAAAAELRPECLTDAALIEMRREAELERVILIGMPSVEEQHAIVDALDNERLLPRDLTLHESLAWCERRGIGLIDNTDTIAH